MSRQISEISVLRSDKRGEKLEQWAEEILAEKDTHQLSEGQRYDDAKHVLYTLVC